MVPEPPFVDVDDKPVLMIGPAMAAELHRLIERPMRGPLTDLLKSPNLDQADYVMLYKPQSVGRSTDLLAAGIDMLAATEHPPLKPMRASRGNRKQRRRAQALARSR